jgi:hypothetical protein
VAEIIDKRLTTRIGMPAPQEVRAISRMAEASFTAGLGQLEALDTARALCWIARGHPRDCTTTQMLDLLTSGAMDEGQRRDLAVLLDAVFRLGSRRQYEYIVGLGAQPKITDHLEDAMLGWRLDLALELLDQAGS